MQKKSALILSSVICLVLVLSVGFASAGWWSDFIGRITGNVVLQEKGSESFSERTITSLTSDFEIAEGNVYVTGIRLNWTDFGKSCNARVVVGSYTGDYMAVEDNARPGFWNINQEASKVRVRIQELSGACSKVKINALTVFYNKTGEVPPVQTNNTTVPVSSCDKSTKMCTLYEGQEVNPENNYVRIVYIDSDSVTLNVEGTQTKALVEGSEYYVGDLTLKIEDIAHTTRVGGSSYVLLSYSLATSSSNVTCTDSDGGKNYWVKGDVTVTSCSSNGSSGGCGASISTDYCTEQSTLGPNLIEYYCNGSVRASEAVTCENGCSNGACLNTSAPVEPTPKCAENYKIRVARFDYDGEDVVSLERYVDGGWEVFREDVAVGDEVSLGDISMTIQNVNRTRKDFSFDLNSQSIVDYVKMDTGDYMVLDNVRSYTFSNAVDYAVLSYCGESQQTCSSLVQEKGMMDLSNYGFNLNYNYTDSYYDYSLDSNVTTYSSGYYNNDIEQGFDIRVLVADSSVDFEESDFLRYMKYGLWGTRSFWINDDENVAYLRAYDSTNYKDRYTIWYNNNVLVMIVGSKYAKGQENLGSQIRDINEFVQSLQDNSKWTAVDMSGLEFQDAITSRYMEKCGSEVEESCSPYWTTKVEPVVCPEHGYQNYIYRDMSGCAQTINYQRDCNPGLCSGCMMPKWFGYEGSSKCVPYGFRFIQDSGRTERITQEDIVEEIIEETGLPVQFTITENNAAEILITEDIDLYNLSNGEISSFVINFDGQEFVGNAGESIVVYPGTHRLDITYFDALGNKVYSQSNQIEISRIQYDDNNENSYIELMFRSNYPAYCDFDGWVKMQKTTGYDGAWASCQNNYECESNLCSSGECVDLKAIAKDVNAFKNAWASITCRITSFLGVDESYEQCMYNSFGVSA